MPGLLLPITLVRDSYFDGETEAAIKEELSTGWLEEAAADFAASSQLLEAAHLRTAQPLSM
jgi:hypothetical protein